MENPKKYLPHREPAILINTINEVDPDRRSCVCKTKLPEESLFAEDNLINEAIAIEIMAQSSACLKGWIDLHRGLPIKEGYLVKIETASFVAELLCNKTYLIRVQMIDEIRNYFLFDCEIKEEGKDETIAIARLGFFVP